MKKYIFGLTVLVCGVFAVQAHAAEFRVPRGDMGSVVVAAEETLGSLYSAGGTINIHGAVEGDMFVAGGSLTATGRVTGDIFATGGNITISGTNGGDVRVAGGNITITSAVPGDLLIGGGTVSISGEGIGGDVWIGGGMVTITAPIRGDVRIGGGEVRIDAPVSGTVVVTSERLTFGPGARATSTVTYYGVEQAVIEDGAMVSNVEFIRQESKNPLWAFATMAFLVQILGMLAALLVAYFFFGNALTRVVRRGLMAPWHNLLIGLVGLIVTPVAIILLFVTVAGYYLALLLLALFLFLLLGACVVAAAILGTKILSWMQRGNGDVVVTWPAVIVGAVLMPLLGLIPIVGWIIAAIVYLIAFGTLIRILYGRASIEYAAARQ